MADKCDLNEIAVLFGVTEKGVRGWIAAGMPILKKGKQGRGGERTEISLRAAIRWYFAENFERLDLDRERTRLARAQAERVDIDNAVRRGELIDAEDAEHEYGMLVAAARARLIQIPDALGQFCDPRYAPVICTEARKRVYEALTELSNGAVADTPAASGTDGEPVGRREPQALKRKQRRARPVAN